MTDQAIKNRNIVTLKDATEICLRSVKAKVVPFIKGSPGLGKSAIVASIASGYNLKLIDMRMAQLEPTDLNGFPFVNGKGRASYAPPDMIPLDSDELPLDDKGQPMNGWLLFLDEFNSAERDTQKAAYKLVLDRMVGSHNVHKNVAMICAGNLDTDNAIVEEMGTAMKSRLIHLEVKADAEEWLEWARAANVDSRITSFIQFKPDMLHKFMPDSPDDTFPCPRTWEFAHRLINGRDKLDTNDRVLLNGTIGSGGTVEFLGFTQLVDSLPSMDAIKADPEGIAVPQEPGVLYALTGALGNAITSTTSNMLMKFVRRMPIEFAITAMREVLARTPDMMNDPEIQQWQSDTANQLF